jgi:hypothetical protein
MKRILAVALFMMFVLVFSMPVKATDFNDLFSFYANDVRITVQGSQWLGNFMTSDKFRFEFHCSPEEPIAEFAIGEFSGMKLYSSSYNLSEKVTDICMDMADIASLSTGTFYISCSTYRFDEYSSGTGKNGCDYIFSISETGKTIANSAEITSVGTVDMYNNNFAELSKDKSNPTMIDGGFGSIKINGNAVLANKQLRSYAYINSVYREITDPDICYSNSAGEFVHSIGTPGGIYNTPLAFKWVVCESSTLLSPEPIGAIICESPTYYVEFVDVNNQYSALNALITSIVLSESSLTIILKSGYTFDGCQFILTDKTTGEKQVLSNMYGDEATFEYANTANGAVGLVFNNLKVIKEHIYEFFVPTHSVFDAEWYANPKANNGMYKTNAEWTTKLVVVPSHGNLFSDVPQENWANEYITDMYARGIVVGYPEGNFRPNGYVTRSEFAKMMYLTLQMDKIQDYSGVIVDQPFFADVTEDDWEYIYVKYVGRYMTAFKAADQKLYFKGNQKAVREDMAVALVKALGLDKNMESEKDLREYIKSTFLDADEISYNLVPYIAIAYKNDLISGYPGGLFCPQQTITRAEASAMLMKVWQSEAMEKVVFE